MIYFTPQDAIELFGGNEGRQALDYITRRGYGSREYLVDGRWVPSPEGKISSRRYRVPPIDDVRIIEKLGNTSKETAYSRRSGRIES